MVRKREQREKKGGELLAPGIDISFLGVKRNGQKKKREETIRQQIGFLQFEPSFLETRSDRNTPRRKTERRGKKREKGRRRSCVVFVLTLFRIYSVVPA